jgi:hypothetical protein
MDDSSDHWEVEVSKIPSEEICKRELGKVGHRYMRSTHGRMRKNGRGFVTRRLILLEILVDNNDDSESL